MAYTIDKVKTITQLDKLPNIDSNTLFIGSSGNNIIKTLTYSTLLTQLNSDIATSLPDITTEDIDNIGDILSEITSNVNPLFRSNISELSASTTQINTNIGIISSDVFTINQNIQALTTKSNTLAYDIERLSSTIGTGGGSNPSTPGSSEISGATTTTLGGIKYWTYGDLTTKFNGGDTSSFIPVIADIIYEDNGTQGYFGENYLYTPYINFNDNVYNRLIKPRVEDTVNDLLANSSVNENIDAALEQLEDSTAQIQNLLNETSSFTEQFEKLGALTDINTDDVNNIKSLATLMATVSDLSKRVSALEKKQGTTSTT